MINSSALTFDSDASLFLVDVSVFLFLEDAADAAVVFLPRETELFS